VEMNARLNEPVDCEALAAKPLPSLLYHVLVTGKVPERIATPDPPAEHEGLSARASGAVAEIFTDILSFARNDGIQVGRLMPIRSSF